MRFIRLALVGLALSFGLAARNASAQSIQQPITFAINAEFEVTTNYSENDTLTNYYSARRNVYVGTLNIVKAIALDVFGEKWTNWSAATILRRINPTTGEEGIFLRTGNYFTNISRFFGTSFLNDFTSDAANAFPGLTNNFTPSLPVFHGWITNKGGESFTNTISIGTLRYLSLNTTNLKFNLVGVNFAIFSNGRLTNVVGTVDHVQYSNDVDAITVNAVGSLYINMATNILVAPPRAYSGIAHGSWSTGTPIFSRFPGPPGP
ncbi:MAG: hypothetical protein ACLQVY_25185 [Limisphaerales bacterium]